jgi:hypothetical protein
MSQTNDIELKKAALVIAKLLLRTREGKLQWENETNLLTQNLLSSCSSYKAKLDEGIEAHLSRDDKGLRFKLCGPPAVDLPTYSYLAPMLGGRDNNEIISVSLDHLDGKTGLITPESIVYRDMEELIFLAENPKSVSDDLRYKQVMSYLDKLAV